MATALALAGVVAVACGGDGENERPIAWRSASEVEPRVLEVRYRIPSGARLRQASADATRDRVVIALRASQPDDGETTLRLEERCVRVELERPVGRRALVDRATGARRRPAGAAPLGPEGCPAGPG